MVFQRAVPLELGARRPSKVINELRLLGGLQKHLVTKYRPEKDAIDEVLVEIKSAIQRLGRDQETATAP